MPNLINVLRRPGKTDQPALTDAQRRKEVEKVLNGGDGVDRLGMEWGTCLVFSCEKDCCEDSGAAVKNCWREEVVLVQWDN